jgi:hypothetical protein
VVSTLQERVNRSAPGTISGVTFGKLFVAVQMALDDVVKTSKMFADVESNDPTRFRFRMACVEFWMLEYGVASGAFPTQVFKDNWELIERPSRLAGLCGLVIADHFSSGYVLNVLRQAADVAAARFRQSLDLQAYREVVEVVL